MSKEQLLAAILELPTEDRRALIAEVIERTGDLEIDDPDMTPELRAELDRRYQDMLEHPEDNLTWEEVCTELDKRKAARRKSSGL